MLDKEGDRLRQSRSKRLELIGTFQRLLAQWLGNREQPGAKVFLPNVEIIGEVLGFLSRQEEFSLTPTTI